jgi:hypothetical protein
MPAKSDALVTWVKVVAKCEVEKTPQEGKCKHHTTVMLQGNPSNLNLERRHFVLLKDDTCIA